MKCNQSDFEKQQGNENGKLVIPGENIYPWKWCGKIELMARIGMERMWKNIYPWTDGKIKINWKVWNRESVENIYF